MRWDTKKWLIFHNHSFPSGILYIMYIWKKHQSPKNISKRCHCKGERRNIELYESLREFWIYPGITSEPANFGEILTQEVPKEVVSFLAKHEALSETDITKLRISFSTSFKNIIVHILSLAQYQYITQMLTSFTSFKVNVFDGWKQIRGSCFSIRIQKGWRKMD